MKLADLFPADALQASIDAGHVTRKEHPTLPLAIHTYTPACQYASAWDLVTMRCRGLIADTKTDEIIGWPFPKFFNIEEHGVDGEGRLWAPTLMKDVPFIVQDKADGSLGIIFEYDGRWMAASKGSFTSEQAQWAQRWLDERETGLLIPGHTYLVEIIYPENRIVVDYGAEQTLKLLAVYDSEGREMNLSYVHEDWETLGGTVIRTYTDVNLSKIMFRAKRSQTFDGLPVPGTQGEGYVLRFATGLRVKVKFAEYVRLHAIVTGLTERHVWDLLKDGCSLKPLLETLPDEYHGWLTATAMDLMQKAWHESGRLLTAFIETSYTAERATFAALVNGTQDSGALSALYDALYTNAWKAVKPEAVGPWTKEE